METIRNPSKEGYPVVLSRNTDVAHWYLDWLRKVLRTGYVIAPDPSTSLPVRWSVDSSHVPVLYFLTKHPKNLLQPLRSWLLPYRVVVSVTITGWEEVEPRAPDLQTQLKGVHDLVEELGVDYLKWRYSPVPTNLLESDELQSRLDRVSSKMNTLGFESVEMSTMLPSPHWEKGYGEDDGEDRDRRLKTLRSAAEIVDDYDLEVGLCTNDNPFIEEIDNASETACIDLDRLNRLFGLNLPDNTLDCRCQKAIEPCNGSEFGCGSGCAYCYVPGTQVGGSE